MPQDDLKKKRQDNEPDYRNMSKVRKTTTAKDSADYRSGFQKASSGRAENFPNKAEKWGQNEAARRGLTKLSSPSESHKQAIYERPDTPLGATPEPKIK
jgi:hypothetical protein